MNIAVIFAGGVGRRMHTKDLPKQFMEVYGKPIIVHTLGIFENHDEIDAIVIACVEEYIPHLISLVDEWHITKTRKIVPGGRTGQESIYNALKAAKDIAGENAIVLIHDGVRPFVSREVISENIRCVKKHGTAITTSKVTETVLLVDDVEHINEVPDRAHSRVAKAPQSFWLKDILKAHEAAISDGINDCIDSCTMMKNYGYQLYLVDGNSDNIKVTTPEDIFAMRSVLEAREILKMHES